MSLATVPCSLPPFYGCLTLGTSCAAIQSAAESACINPVWLQGHLGYCVVVTRSSGQPLATHTGQARDNLYRLTCSLQLTCSEDCSIHNMNVTMSFPPHQEEEMQPDTSKKKLVPMDPARPGANCSFLFFNTQKVSFWLGTELGAHAPGCPTCSSILPVGITHPRTPA